MSYRPFQPNPQTIFGALHTESMTVHNGQVFLYSINPRLYNTITTGSGIEPAVNDSRAEVQTGTSASSSSRLESKRSLKYHPGIGAELMYTALFPVSANGVVAYVGMFNSTDGFGFGLNGLTFGIYYISRSVVNFIPQTSWSRDVCDGSQAFPFMDWRNGNLFRIEYEYLGYGHIQFSIQNPNTCSFEIVHVIEYANSSALTSISNPNLKFTMHTENTTNTSNIPVYSASYSLKYQSTNHPKPQLPLSISHTQTVATTLTNIITIRPQDPFQGRTNYEAYTPLKLSLTADGFTKPVTVSLLQGAVLGGGSFTEFSNSFMEYNLTSTTATNGVPLLSYVIGFDNSVIIDLNELDLLINQDSITLAAITSQGSGDLSASIIFNEDL